VELIPVSSSHEPGVAMSKIEEITDDVKDVRTDTPAGCAC